MRQIFTSPRLENVEKVAEMLNGEGIDTWISESRSYKGNRRGGFSYRDSTASGSQPAVWIVKADDITRARQIMLDAGLLANTRSESWQPLPESKSVRPSAGRTARRMRIVLLILVALASCFSLLRTCSKPPQEDRSHIVPVSTSLP
jgi:hypothetical protein